MSTALFRKLHEPAALGAPGALIVSVDGERVSAEPGDSVASVLIRVNPPLSRTTPVHGSPRAPFCMMGVCFDCLAIVDGVPSTQTCLVQVRNGMYVERQQGRREVPRVASDAGFDGERRL